MPHTFRTRRFVEFSDTDMAGIAHFSSFFRYMESAEHELVRSVGLSVFHVVDEAQRECEVQKSESMDRMIELGVLRTPSVAFDGQVVLSGHIPKSDEVKRLLGLA